MVLIHKEINQMYRWISTVVLFLGFLLWVVPHSAAAAGCYGTGCNGRDPIEMGCHYDAYTVSSTPITTQNGTVVGRVELRWSPRCQANWARAESHVGPTSMFVQLLECSKAPVSGTYYELPHTSSVYGDMRGGLTVRAQGAFGRQKASDTFGITGCY